MSLLNWTFYIVGSALIVAITIGAAITVISWLQPRIRRLQQGVKATPGMMECCPPGLGCNDPDPSYRKCLRRQARRVGKVEEILMLDGAWVAFNGASRRSRRRAQLHADYHEIRNNIIARALGDVAEKLNEERILRLPEHIEEHPLPQVVGKGNGSPGTSSHESVSGYVEG